MVEWPRVDWSLFESSSRDDRLECDLVGSKSFKSLVYCSLKSRPSQITVMIMTFQWFTLECLIRWAQKRLKIQLKFCTFPKAIKRSRVICTLDVYQWPKWWQRFGDVALFVIKRMNMMGYKKAATILNGIIERNFDDCKPLTNKTGMSQRKNYFKCYSISCSISFCFASLIAFRPVAMVEHFRNIVVRFEYSHAERIDRDTDRETETEREPM